MNRTITSLLGIALLAVTLFASPANAGQYLVTASNGPSFDSPEEAVRVLESTIFPMFEELIALEKDGKLTGGLPVGDRAFTFVLEAKTNEEADRMIRSIPAWAFFQWSVVPLESIADRARQEKDAVKAIKMASR